MRALSISKVDSNRAEIFGFIRRQFWLHYGATIEDDGTDLYAAIDRSGDLEAAFYVNDNPVNFTSAYYTGNVITALEHNFDRSLHNQTVVELSHLALRQPRSLCRLNSSMVDFLYERTDYLVCTVVKPIANFFQRRSFAPVKLATASQQALPKQQQHNWGTYYCHSPVVVAGDIAVARAATLLAA